MVSSVRFEPAGSRAPLCSRFTQPRDLGREGSGEPARKDRRHDHEKLLEGHPQLTKSALAENESVKI
jgi:hypothetical protein